MNDENRMKIKVGDTIEFIKVPQQDETVKVQVTGITKYDTFKEM